MLGSDDADAIEKIADDDGNRALKEKVETASLGKINDVQEANR
jgi:hypothetical protein